MAEGEREKGREGKGRGGKGRGGKGRRGLIIEVSRDEVAWARHKAVQCTLRKIPG